jgi:hypothetical protein
MGLAVVIVLLLCFVAWASTANDTPRTPFKPEPWLEQNRRLRHQLKCQRLRQEAFKSRRQ